MTTAHCEHCDTIRADAERQRAIDKQAMTAAREENARLVAALANADALVETVERTRTDACHRYELENARLVAECENYLANIEERQVELKRVVDEVLAARAEAAQLAGQVERLKRLLAERDEFYMARIKKFANRTFNGFEKDYPSNVADTFHAWFGGWLDGLTGRDELKSAARWVEDALAARDGSGR